MEPTTHQATPPSPAPRSSPSSFFLLLAATAALVVSLLGVALCDVGSAYPAMLARAQELLAAKAASPTVATTPAPPSRGFHPNCSFTMGHLDPDCPRFVSSPRRSGGSGTASCRCKSPFYLP